MRRSLRAKRSRLRVDVGTSLAASAGMKRSALLGLLALLSSRPAHALSGACDGEDSDLCKEGQWQRVGLSDVCSEDALTCIEDFCWSNADDDLDRCNGTDDDCDPTTPDGSGEWLVRLRS